MYYREWCLKPFARRGTMVPLSILNKMLKAKDTGYASVYMFDQNAAKLILSERSSTGFARYPVYSDELIIDLDNGNEQLVKAEAVLKLRRLGYSVWHSGSKGYHIYIPLKELMSGKDVPYSQRKFVETLDIGADLSLYQHGRILSLPGRVHPKTGQRKKLVKTVKGDKLEIPMLVAPELRFGFTANGGLDDLEAGLWKLLTLLGDEPEPGNRHTQLWSTALHFADAGVSYEATLELLTEVNDKWTQAKDLTEVELAVKQAYKR